jgi:eukaryotic-like serine/threonine-protein kinase
MIGKTISHYTIIEKLGSGGMGDVYKAEDTKLQRTVALKFLPTEFTRNDEARERFVHEARAASALDHPNIGTIYEINDDHEGQFFIAMACYEGQTLKDKMAQGPLDVAEAIDITVQIVNGLARAHAKDIIHRDIKPANIMLTEDGQVKIIDFGLAKLKGQSLLTKTGTTMGTVAYMSPEQAQGDKVDQRSDIWSVGVMLYEMLAGEKPFKGEYEQAIMYLILNEEPEFITKVRKDVPLLAEQILEKTLAKNPEKRYQTMEQMSKELAEVTEELKEGESKTASIFKLGRRQRKWVYRLSVIFILITILGIYLWQNKIAQASPVSIVLLPLKSISQEVGQEWFSDGMTDALITDLAKISGLKVISSSSAMKYKGTDKTPPEIAAELGVQYVIEGSIIRMSDQVKISARLINAPEDEYLWAEEYERGFSDILGLQGEIAQTIARQIEVKLTHQEETRLATTRSVNPETYELYLKGMYHLNKYTPEGIAKGLDYLHQATEKDSTDALAYAGLALGYDIIAHTPSPPPGALSKAKEAALRALKLDETLAEAHLALAMIKIYSDWDREGAEKSYRYALQLKPSLAQAHNHYAWLLLLLGKYDYALAELYEAQELDPLEAIYPAWQGMMFNWLERYDEAIDEARKSIELVADFPVGLNSLGCAYAAKGMYEEAIAAHQKAGAISLDWKWSLGQTYALAGRRDEALAVAVELESQPKVWYTWGLAEIYTALGDKDKAFYWLEEAFKQRHPYIQWIRRNVSFKSLQDDPRFLDLARRMNIPD